MGGLLRSSSPAAGEEEEEVRTGGSSSGSSNNLSSSHNLEGPLPLCLDSAAAAAADADAPPASSSDALPAPLIPGLPDDLALHCLLRLPLATHPTARTVSRAWTHALTRPDYYTSRRTLGLAEPRLLVFAFHKSTGRMHWQSLDPHTRTWHTVPPMPRAEHRASVCPAGFGCAADPAAGALYVCGGMRSDMDCPMDAVLHYSLRTNRWTPRRRMTTPRSFFAAAAIGGRVFAAGGNSTDCTLLGSAEAYAPADDAWAPVAPMAPPGMARFDAAVVRGKLHLTEGWSWPFLAPPRGQVYDPERDAWDDMAPGLREGWTGLSVVLAARLFIITDHEEHFKLKVYHEDTDSWGSVLGQPMPAPPMSRPFSVNAIDGKLYVVAYGLHVLVGAVTASATATGGGGTGTTGTGTSTVFSVEWEVIPAPDRFADFNPSTSQVLHA